MIIYSTLGTDWGHFQIELEFRNVTIWWERKMRVPWEKPLGSRTRTNNKLNPHMTPSPGIKPGPHWWEVSALTTAPSPKMSLSLHKLACLNVQTGSTCGGDSRDIKSILLLDCSTVYLKDCTFYLFVCKQGFVLPIQHIIKVISL